MKIGQPQITPSCVPFQMKIPPYLLPIKEEVELPEDQRPGQLRICQLLLKPALPFSIMQVSAMLLCLLLTVAAFSIHIQAQPGKNGLASLPPGACCPFSGFSRTITEWGLPIVSFYWLCQKKARERGTRGQSRARGRTWVWSLQDSLVETR